MLIDLSIQKFLLYCQTVISFYPKLMLHLSIYQVIETYIRPYCTNYFP